MAKRDVPHLIYVKIKPYLIFSVVLANMAWFQTFPSTKVSDEIKFQNANKRENKIIYFYVTKTPQYKNIVGDSQIHIISNLGLGRRLPQN